MVMKDQVLQVGGIGRLYNRMHQRKWVIKVGGYFTLRLWCRRIPYYTAEEVKLIRILREEYKNATIEHRKAMFQDTYNLWINNFYYLHWIDQEGRKVNDAFAWLPMLIDRAFIGDLSGTQMGVLEFQCIKLWLVGCTGQISIIFDTCSSSIGDICSHQRNMALGSGFIDGSTHVRLTRSRGLIIAANHTRRHPF